MKKSVKRLARRAFAMFMAATLSLGGLSGMTAEAATAVEKTDNVIKTAYNQFNPNTNTSNTVSGGFAENGYGTVVLNDENPTATDVAFCHYWGAHIAGWPNGFQMIAVERNTNPSVATAKARSTENGLVVDFQQGTKAGTTTITVGFTVTTLRPDANIASSGQTYAGFSGYLYYTVTNNGSNGSGGAENEKPAPPSDADVEDFYNSNIAVIVRCVNRNDARHNGSLGRLAKDSYTIGEVEPYDGSNYNLNQNEWSWMCKIHVDQEYYLKLWSKNFESKHGTHYLEDKNKDVFAPFYYFNGGYCTYTGGNLSEGWYCLTEDAPVYVDITEKAPVIIETEYTVIYTDGVEDEIVFQDEEYRSLKAGGDTPVFRGKEDGTKTEDGIVKPIRDGYTFMGWTPAVNPKVSADDADENGKIIYTAIWKENEYTVIYTDGVMGEIVFPDQGYEGLKEGDDTPAFKGENGTAEPIRDGYTFMGWAPAVNPKVSADDADEDGKIIYTATWKQESSSQTSTSYTVVHEYYTNGKKTGEVSETFSDKKVDDVVYVSKIAKKPEYEGKEYNHKSTTPTESLTLGSEESENVITLRYERTETPETEDITYRVEWYDAESGDLIPEEVKEENPESRTGKAGETVKVTESDKKLKGYTFVASDDRNVLSDELTEAGTVLKLYFAKETETPDPTPEEVEYQVEWYDAESGELIPSEVKEENPESRTGKAGETVKVTESDKKLKGYTFVASDDRNVLSDELTEAGTVLKLYFAKETETPDPTPEEVEYQVEWYDAESGELIPSEVKEENPESRTGKAGETVKVTESDKKLKGYTFVASDDRNVLSDELTEAGTVLKLYFAKEDGDKDTDTDPDIPEDPKPIIPPDDPAPKPEVKEKEVRYRVVYYRNHEEGDSREFLRTETKSVTIASDSDASRKGLMELAEKSDLFDVIGEEPERDGYQFVGWSLVRNGNEDVVEAGTAVPWLSGDDQGAVREAGDYIYEFMFYAQWSKLPERPATSDPDSDPDPTPNPNPAPEEPVHTDNGGSSGGGGHRGGGGSDSGNGPGVIPDTVEIQTDQVPLSALPDLPAEEPLTWIDDDEVPLAGLPKTGEAVSLAKLMFLLSGSLLGAWGVLFRKKEEE